MEHKTFAGGFATKSEARGEVTAVVGSLGTVDLDREIIAHGAVPPESKVVVSPWGHAALTGIGSAPVGAGVVTPQGSQLVFDGRLFMAIQAGRETFALLSEMGSAQGWSVGFRVLKADAGTDAERKAGAVRVLRQIELLEVSPVVIPAAGPGRTRTTSVKHAIQPLGTADHAELARIAAKYDRRFQGEPLPAHLGPAFAFACEELLLKDRPVARIVPPFLLPPGLAGVYYTEHDTIHLSNRLPDEDLTRALFHECVHSYEGRKSWIHSEPFAEHMERTLFDRWRDRVPAYSTH